MFLQKNGRDVLAMFPFRAYKVAVHMLLLNGHHQRKGEKADYLAPEEELQKKK